MNAIVTIAVWFLALFALVQASIVEPPESTKTAREYGTAMRRVKRWPYWIAGVALAVPLFTAWSALRFALYLASFLAAWVSVRLATATAMDDRAIRVYRASTWREVPS